MNTLSIPHPQPFIKLKNFSEHNKDREHEVFGQAERTYRWTPVHCLMDNVMNYYIVFFMVLFLKNLFVLWPKGVFFSSFVLSILFASVIVLLDSPRVGVLT